MAAGRRRGIHDLSPCRRYIRSQHERDQVSMVRSRLHAARHRRQGATLLPSGLPPGARCRWSSMGGLGGRRLNSDHTRPQKCPSATRALARAGKIPSETPLLVSELLDPVPAGVAATAEDAPACVAPAEEANELIFHPTPGPGPGFPPYWAGRQTTRIVDGSRELLLALAWASSSSERPCFLWVIAAVEFHVGSSLHKAAARSLRGHVRWNDLNLPLGNHPDSLYSCLAPPGRNWPSRRRPRGRRRIASGSRQCRTNMLRRTPRHTSHKPRRA